MVWDWGFNWQRVQVDGGAIAFNISGRGGDTGQGIGSVSIIGEYMYMYNCAREDTRGEETDQVQIHPFPTAPLPS